MNVLITGGTGFIGSRLAIRLIDQGHRVRLLSLIKTKAERENAEELGNRGAELLEASVADRSMHEQALRDVDVVHHIAALMREADVPDSMFWDVNVRATQDLVHASERAGVRRFVYCSSIGVTGGVRGRRVDETEPYHPANIYGRTKAAAEEWVLARARESGFPLSAIRPADVYGPGDQRYVKMFRMIQKGRFFYLGSGRGRRHMIYIDDLIDGMLAAQERDEAVGQVFILAGPSPIALRELAGLMAAELHVRPPWLRLPYWPTWLASAVVQAVAKPLGVQPPIYPRRVEFYHADYEFDTAKARDVLGWTPRVDVGDGIRRTLDAYREAGLVDPPGS